MLFRSMSNAISISYLKQNKAHSPKLAELANILSTMPNILSVFLAGKWNVLADQLSRSIHKAAISEEQPDKSITEMVVDIKRALGKDITHLSPEGFQQYLLQDQEGPMFDLLKKEYSLSKLNI